MALGLDVNARLPIAIKELGYSFRSALFLVSTTCTPRPQSDQIEH